MFAAASAALFLGLPAGVTSIELPQEPVRPIVHQLYASGACAVMHTDLGFIALTTDDGKTFRYLPAPPELEGNARLLCHRDRFFIATGGQAFTLTSSSWQRTSSGQSDHHSRFSGLVAAGDRLYLGTGSRILVSTDGGASFVPTLSGVRALSSDGTRVLAAKERELFTVDGNDQLTVAAKLDRPVQALAFAGGAWFAATERGVHRSEDGQTFKREAGAPAGVLELVGAGAEVIAHATGSSHRRSERGSWSSVRDAPRIRPGASGAWVHARAGYIARVLHLDEKVTQYLLPHNPMPTVRAVAASGRSLVVALFRQETIYASDDAGRTFRAACKNMAPDAAVLDGDRLQLTRGLPDALKGCRVAGFKTRVVPQLPEETCNGDLCVRFAASRLLRSSDRGRTWLELTRALGSGERVVAAAAARRELLVARGSTWSMRLSMLKTYNQVLRSTDDGKTFSALVMPGPITSFAPGPDGWLVGTVMYGLLLVPYAQ